MSVNLSPVGNGFQFFTNNGEPLVGGKLDTYQAGSTTPLTTYTDSSGLIANTNPTSWERTAGHRTRFGCPRDFSISLC